MNVVKTLVNVEVVVVVDTVGVVKVVNIVNKDVNHYMVFVGEVINTIHIVMSYK
jgi:hypothetical protein